MDGAIRIGFNVPFDEAITTALAREIELPDIYYGELQGVARALAFSVAGMAATDQIRQVRDSLAAAMERGATFSEWRAELLEAPDALNLPRHRLDNIFRTNIQGAYSRGQWRSHDAHRESRPYLLYSAINDSRVRPNHLAMDGFVSEIKDSIWKKWYPPNGYRCRCSVISLSESEAIEYMEEDMARLAANPDLEGRRLIEEPDPGWDYHGGADDPIERIKKVAKKKKRSEKKAPATPNPEPKRQEEPAPPADPWRFNEIDYSGDYDLLLQLGKLRLAQAEARVKEQRDKAIPELFGGQIDFFGDKISPETIDILRSMTAEHVANLLYGMKGSQLMNALRVLGIPSNDDLFYSGIIFEETKKRLDSALISLPAQIRADLLSRADIGGVGAVAAKGSNKNATARVNAVTDRLPRGWVEISNKRGAVRFRDTKDRAHYDHTNKVLLVGHSASVAAHEYMHRMQYTVPGLDNIFQTHHKKRTAGERLEQLRVVTGNAGYRRDEVTRKDKFADPYQGKEYQFYRNEETMPLGNGVVIGKALEQITMATEGLLSDNLKDLDEILQKDRESVELGLGAIHHYRVKKEEWE